MASTAAAQLRQLVVDAFDQDELRALCYDLDVDYDSLPGESKVARVLAVIAHFARRQRLPAFIQHCAEQRTTVDWSAVLQAAQTDPNQFLPDAVDAERVPESADSGVGIVLDAKNNAAITLNANRALKLGFAAGVLVVLLFGCGLVAGLLASRVVSINPVQPNAAAAKDVRDTLQVLKTSAPIILPPANADTSAIPSAVQRKITFSSVDITSFADELIRGSRVETRVNDVHVRFEQNQTVLTFRDAKTQRQMAVAYTVQAQRGRLILTPQSAWVHGIELRGSTVGWFPMPVGWASEMTEWIQQYINQSTDDFFFTSIQTRPDEIVITGARTRRR